MTNDNQTNHPDYYNTGYTTECIEAMKAEFGEDEVAIFDKLSAFKYIWRKGLKDNNPEEREKQKIEWYIRDYNSRVPFPLNCLNEDYLQQLVDKYRIKPEKNGK